MMSADSESMCAVQSVALIHTTRLGTLGAELLPAGGVHILLLTSK